MLSLSEVMGGDWLNDGAINLDSTLTVNPELREPAPTVKVLPQISCWEEVTPNMSLVVMTSPTSNFQNSGNN
jgi:hypothetical protein